MGGVPRMSDMLAHRGFEARAHRTQEGPVELADASGVILGAPTVGLGIRSRAPNESFVEYGESIVGIGEVHMGVFTVHQARLGDSLQRLKGLVLRVWARFVAWYGFPRWDVSRGEHVLPAECMVRVR